MGNLLSLLRRILPGVAQDHQTAHYEAATANTASDNQHEENISRKSSSDSSVSSQSDEIDLVGTGKERNNEIPCDVSSTNDHKAEAKDTEIAAVSDGREQIGATRQPRDPDDDPAKVVAPICDHSERPSVVKVATTQSTETPLENEDKINSQDLIKSGPSEVSNDLEVPQVRSNIAVDSHQVDTKAVDEIEGKDSTAASIEAKVESESGKETTEISADHAENATAPANDNDAHSDTEQAAEAPAEEQTTVAVEEPAAPAAEEPVAAEPTADAGGDEGGDAE